MAANIRINQNAVRMVHERDSVLTLQNWRERRHHHQDFLTHFDADLTRIMQFSGGRSRKEARRSQLEGTQNAGKYGHGLQMYKVPPTDNITLEEFEEFAIDRLKGKLKSDDDNLRDFSRSALASFS